MTQETAKLRKPSNAYSIFILVLTVLSLAVMVVHAAAPIGGDPCSCSDSMTT